MPARQKWSARVYRRHGAVVVGLDGNHDASAVFSQRTSRFDIRVGVDPQWIPASAGDGQSVADMGAQPANLQPNLVPATSWQDRSTPISRIAWPPDGAFVAGPVITIAGSAADTGGGVVGGVELSVDGGASWHPAKGVETWSYEWAVPAGVTSAVIMSRAADDTGNIEVPQSRVSIRVGTSLTNR